MQPHAALVQMNRSLLSSCPVCPAKGTCVFVTPGYEPGYCLHEFRLLHAFLARRLRSHPAAGASEFSRLAVEAQRFVEQMRKERPFDPSLLVSLGGPHSGGQLTLERFAAPAPA